MRAGHQWGDANVFSYLAQAGNAQSALIGHPVFPIFLHYTIMWLVLMVFKLSDVAPMVDWSMTLPFFVTAYVAIQLSRIFVAADRSTTAMLYLSFGPFAIYCISAREMHTYLAGLWFIFLLIVNQRGYCPPPPAAESRARGPGQLRRSNRFVRRLSFAPPWGGGLPPTGVGTSCGPWDACLRTLCGSLSPCTRACPLPCGFTTRVTPSTEGAPLRPENDSLLPLSSRSRPLAPRRASLSAGARRAVARAVQPVHRAGLELGSGHDH